MPQRRLHLTRAQGAVLTALLAATPSIGNPADEPSRTADFAQASGPPAPKSDGRRTLRRLPANVGQGLVGVWSRESAVPFLVGAAGAGGAAFVDDAVRDAVSDPDSGFGESLEWPGKLPATTLPVVALFAAGRVANGERFRAWTYDLGEAALVSSVYTGLLKVTVQRERPDGSNNHSFPSGHASHAFTLAAVTQRHYGWKVGVPMYALAGVVGYSRMVLDKHYLSDVVAGATIGFIVGHAVVRLNDRPLEEAPGGADFAWSVSPLLTRDARGLHLAVSF